MAEDPIPNPDPQPNPHDEAVKRATFERDKSNAALAKAMKEIEILRAAMPSDDQIAKWKEREQLAEKEAEERQRKAGEFDAIRRADAEKFEAQIKAQQKQTEAAKADATAADARLNETLIGLAFSNATMLFGEKGRYYMLPDMARAYFARNVEVQTDDHGNKSVIVKDNNNIPKTDPKTNQPMEFSKALQEVIDEHPQKDSFLRGSGLVGSDSAGGGRRPGQIDTSRLKGADFRDAKVRQAVKKELAVTGGLQVGRFFDKMAQK